jgi:MFS family permease
VSAAPLIAAPAVPLAAQRATTRRKVVAFGASLAFLSFLDRAAISQAAPWIVRDLHLTPAQMGLIFSAFGFAYAAGEIPSGRLGDRFGARPLLTRVVIGWSIFTTATGIAWNFMSMFTVRLLFGAGESGCFPGIACLFRSSLTPAERNSAEGVKAASARWGAALTPALMALLFQHLSWRETFALFGLVGIAWAAIFHAFAPDVADHAPAHAAPVSWPKLLRSRTAWALGLQWFAHYYGFYFYITWLPLYLLQARHLDLGRGALAAGAPLFAAGLGSLIAGWTTTALTARLGVLRARRILGYVSYAGAAALLLAFTAIENPGIAIAALSLSSFAAEFSGPISWTTAIDIGREHAGTVAGFMNTLGHFGGSVAPAVTGFLLTFTGHSWNTAFYCSAAIYAAGAICWRMIDSTQTLELTQTAPYSIPRGGHRTCSRSTFRPKH